MLPSEMGNEKIRFEHRHYDVMNPWPAMLCGDDPIAGVQCWVHASTAYLKDPKHLASLAAQSPALADMAPPPDAF